MPFSETLLPEFDEEMKRYRRLLDCVPDGKFDYQPHPKSMTLGRLATHLAEIPSWTALTLDVEVFELPADFKPRLATSRAELLAIFDKGVSRGPREDRHGNRRRLAQDLDHDVRRKDLHVDAAVGGNAQRHHESYDSSPRAIGRLPAPQRRSVPGHVWAFRG